MEIFTYDDLKQLAEKDGIQIELVSDRFGYDIKINNRCFWVKYNELAYDVNEVYSKLKVRLKELEYWASQVMIEAKWEHILNRKDLYKRIDGIFYPIQIMVVDNDKKAFSYKGDDGIFHPYLERLTSTSLWYRTGETKLL